MPTWIGEIVETVPVLEKSKSNQFADALFRDVKTCEGIVVLEEKHPIGLITKTNFYQKLGTLYGYNLFMGKQVEVLMNRDILVVDMMTSIVEVSRLAMNRKDEQLYDYVIVTESELYKGVVSIRNLLMKFAEVQAKVATYLNPLTGLPGNHVIDERLKHLSLTNPFSVLYIDLDHFKSYNDVYGFSNGDKVLEQTAHILQEELHDHDHFLGHIGGDDYIAILYKHDFTTLCQRITESFDEKIRDYYNKEDLGKNYVLTENRFGMKDKIPLVSISIAVVSNREQTFSSVEEIVHHATFLKKRCKMMKGSIFLANDETNMIKGSVT
ncbi:GGDEF domain-containing protein [Radiobacillus kanasensis]|uniref:GGDEF domain-containing protein n=1 Tax=Radiobacillus kanasensis TaxID=2844358 RepID=UPI001E2F53C4|nr:GGDEF domain-containing protein [Radiobacillus kanasensis]UFT98273.1 GGDEF domain-containing protein [Radiobacillus kanasensis]